MFIIEITLKFTARNEAIWFRQQKRLLGNGQSFFLFLRKMYNMFQFIYYTIFCHFSYFCTEKIIE